MLVVFPGVPHRRHQDVTTTGVPGGVNNNNNNNDNRARGIRIPMMMKRPPNSTGVIGPCSSSGPLAGRKGDGRRRADHEPSVLRFFKNSGITPRPASPQRENESS